MKLSKNVILGGIVVIATIGLILIFRKGSGSGDSNKKPKKSKLPNADKYSQFSSDPLKVAEELTPLATGKYKWTSGSGMPIDIYFKGSKPLFTKTPDGSTYCTGYTFATFFVTALNRGLLDDFTDNDIVKLQQTWNQGDASKKPKLVVDALTKPVRAGIEPLGKEVTLENAQPGDFAQIWRTTGSGHSVIFMEHLKKDGKIIGFKYYSSNSGINQKTGRSGAGEGTEKFSDSGGKMIRGNTYFARLKKS